MRGRWVALISIYAVPALYVATLLLATHIPDRYVSWRDPPEILLHALAYGGLTLLILAVAVPHAGSDGHDRAWWLYSMWVLLLAALGLVDELSQPLSGRLFQATDWLADLVGILVATGLTIACRAAIGRFKQ